MRSRHKEKVVRSDDQMGAWWVTIYANQYDVGQRQHCHSLKPGQIIIEEGTQKYQKVE